ARAARGAWPALARRVPADRRGDRADPPDRLVDPARRVRAERAVDARGPPRAARVGERVGAAVPRPRVRRARAPRARRERTAGGLARARAPREQPASRPGPHPPP